MYKNLNYLIHASFIQKYINYEKETCDKRRELQEVIYIEAKSSVSTSKVEEEAG